MQENKWVINVLLVIIMILVVVACIFMYMCLTNDVELIEEKDKQALFSEEDYPNVESIMATLPLAEEFKSNFIKTDINEVEVKHSKLNNAYTNLINGKTDLILGTYPTDEEKKLAESKGIELEIIPVAKDAFVFFVNKDNPIENLTLNQIQNIYSGKIKSWKEVGGEETTIKAFQRPQNSESQKGMLKLVMQGIKMLEPIKETITGEVADIIDVISDYDNDKNAIGYSYYYYSKLMYTNENIKLLSVNGIKPTYDNIKTGLYNLQTEYYAIIRKNEQENSDVRKLLNAMISEEGQDIAKEAGYVQNY